MSAKRSWDIRPNPRRTAGAKVDTVVPWARPVPVGRGQSLKERRKKARHRLLILFGVVLVTAVGACTYVLWRPEMRIKNISVEASGGESIEPLVRDTLSGTFTGVLPRDSILLFSKEKIRTAIMKTYPEIAAVSVSRTGLDSIKIQTIARVSAFDWCGATPTADVSCYQTDAEGLIFAPAVAEAPALGASTTPPTMLRIYAPLTASSTGEAIRSYVDNPGVIPAALKFERAIESLGADVVSIQIRNDEADLYLTSGTRLTYVLGQEEKAIQLAATAFPQLNLNDGSVDYVDLRFDGKVYFKKRGG